MGESLPPLTAARLCAGGFVHVGIWELNGLGALRLEGASPTGPGVYAFIRDDVAQYVGVASRDLTRRLYFYARPGPSQLTNIRINELLKSVLSTGSAVDVYVATPPDLEWQGWQVSGAVGLEAALIRSYHLPWNKRGTVKAAAPAGVMAVEPRTTTSSSRGPAALPGASEADRIRDFIERKIFAPARGSGASVVEVAARHVHDRMGLRSRFPSVCQVLAGGTLQRHCNVRLIGRVGPVKSSTTVFRFELL